MEIGNRSQGDYTPERREFQQKEEAPSDLLEARASRKLPGQDHYKGAEMNKQSPVSNSPLIEGTVVVRRTPREAMMAAAAVYPTSMRGMAIYRPAPGRSVLLRQVRIVTRASGRRRRHLSYYLVGTDQAGLLYEIFLGLVEKAKNWLFRARLKLQQAGLQLANWLLSPGLNSAQKLAIVL